MPISSVTAAAAHAFLAQGAWDREQLAKILTSAGNDRRLAERLRAPTAVAVVTGQQPALGGGPLYTLVKTASAMVQSERLVAAGIDATAVFWCASEDHDLGEANHADLLRRDGRIARVASDLGGGRASLRFRPAHAWFPLLLTTLHEELGTGPGAEFLRAHPPIADESTGAWLARLMRALFPGLLTIEAHQLRPLMITGWQRALSAWPAIELATLRAQLLAEGAADAFGDLAAPPAFVDRADGRVALSVDAARALLLSDPLALSAGAALRPVLQQLALPALVYVGGPGELAYHRFITPLYAALHATPPQLLPRQRVTLVPGWCARAAAAWGLTPTDIATGAQPASAPARPEVTAFDAALDDLETHTELRGPLRRLRREQQRLHAAVTRAQRRHAGLTPIGTLHAWLRPRELPQDRVMSLAQAVWEFGPGIAGELVRQLRELPMGVEKFITL